MEEKLDLPWFSYGYWKCMLVDTLTDYIHMWSNLFKHVFSWFLFIYPSHNHSCHTPVKCMAQLRNLFQLQPHVGHFVTFCKFYALFHRLWNLVVTLLNIVAGGVRGYGQGHTWHMVGTYGHEDLWLHGLTGLGWLWVLGSYARMQWAWTTWITYNRSFKLHTIFECWECHVAYKAFKPCLFWKLLTII